MAYDIYGNPLRRGYCEVHPDVHEEYPCYICNERAVSPHYPEPTSDEYCEMEGHVPYAEDVNGVSYCYCGKIVAARK